MVKAKPFWERVDKSGRCWIWTGSKNRKGYGTLKVNGTSDGAHRVAYELVKGPIPEGLELDHLCRVPSCVNPDHLEAVTRQTNILRGVSFAAEHAKKVECPKGHPYDAQDRRGSRFCKACANENRRHSWREQQLANGREPELPNGAKSTCPRGHTYDVFSSRGRRVCSICERERNRRRAAERKAQRNDR